MFPDWAMCLLKYYDFCGFYTKTHNNLKKIEFSIFIGHIILAFYLTISIILFIKQPIISADFPLNMANNLFQFLSGLVAYWIIIFESYFKRDYQKKFWKIYKQNLSRCFQREYHLNLRSYLYKFCEFMLAFSIIQILLIHYFLSIMGAFFYFIISYFVIVKMYQSRIFYYLFYMELIRNELEKIHKELKYHVLMSQSNACDFEKNIFKRIRECYGMVYQMVSCINNIFGWSQFATILFSLHLLLTELNWAFIRIYERPIGYIIGIYIHIINE